MGGIGEIPDRRKLTAKELELFFNKGAKVVPLEVGARELGENLKEEIISKGAEIKRSESSDMWKDREKFLSNFKWENMVDELAGDVGEVESKAFAEELKGIFWKYKAVFWNGSWDHWSRAKIEDLDIELIDNYQPAVDKYRRISDEKAAVLTKYVEDLLKAGVLEKATGMGEFAANPHVVSQIKQTSSGPVHKWRFTTDFRQQNKAIRNISYRLQIMEELLRKASSSGKYYISLRFQYL